MQDGKKQLFKASFVVGEDRIRQELETVMDPELHLSLIDLGLIYAIVTYKSSKVQITMTLTSLGCPLFPIIEQDIQNAMHRIGIKNTKIDLTFDPPWSMDRLSERGRAMLGI
jgi:metal-sulfur cluster biosynthetic enzyme